MKKAAKKLVSIRSSKKSGLPPGTLIHVGEKRVENVEISVMDFTETEFAEHPGTSAEECGKYLRSKTVTWIDIVGLHDVGLIKTIGESFEIHPLVMEDILNTEQRAKVQDLGDYLFIVLKMVRPEEDAFESEQVSIILKNQCVLTFQEQKGDVFESIRDRIRSDKGKVRRSAADYLVYTLIDSIIDGYFPYLETINESLEETEARLLVSQDLVSLKELHARKRELMTARKHLWPMRDIVLFLERGDTMLMTRSTNIYLKDVYDHIINIMDTMDSLRDVVTGLLELYLSTSSYRTNEVMKVLTIIATIFIPLTFVTGIYGMNFIHMPLLSAKGGFALVMIVMFAIAGGMMLYFKKKKWL